MNQKGWAYLLALVGGAPITAVAQTAVPRVSFGIVAAVNSATLGGSDATGTGSRVGFSAGGFARIALTPAWAFQPELEYSVKGAQSTFYSGGGSFVSATLDLRYIEMPLLFRVTATGNPAVRFFGEFGPALAGEVDCTITGATQGASVSEPCSNFVDVNSFDVGAVIGGGLEFPLDTYALSLGVRYNLGLADVYSGGSDAKNRNLQFVAGLRF